MDRIESVDIIVALDRSHDEAFWRKKIARKLRVHPNQVQEMRLRKHSIDARQKDIKVQLRIEVGIGMALPPEPVYEPHYPKVAPSAKRVIIVGCGPAGMFAALKALELGLKPIIIERGKDASARRFDLGPILREGRVIEDSNYCFGEGGAGTFSDGKLYTRATKRGPVRDVYETFVAHGAPPKILVDAHPHIGSNLLPNVVKAMRASIIAAGGEVHFETKVVELLTSADGKTMNGVATADGIEFIGDAVILATGHSARDIYKLLAKQNILMEQKTFAVGVRIEHPQPLIDSIQYHYQRGLERPRILPAASYRLACKIGGRGVHSFCMCPGGFIVPAATENDEVVVNGMSLSRRDSAYANSGMVVSVDPDDTREFDREHGILSGMAFQKALEVSASVHGGGKQKAPGQRVTDFLEEQESSSLPSTSYFPGLNSSPLHEVMPSFIVSRMQTGLRKFGKGMHGYITEEAGLIGFETRTSSPLRIPRNDGDLQHPEIAGLYPCAEGAGYAGGIISAALDGIKCAEAAAGVAV
jgi:uncharacterized FAD-dependent dehydrogenase